MTVPFRQSEAIERVGSLYRDDLVRLEELARAGGAIQTSWTARFLESKEFDAEDVDRLVLEAERRGLEASGLVTLKLHLTESPIVIFDSSHWYKGFVSLSLANPHAEWEKSHTLDGVVRAVIEYVGENEGDYCVSFHTRQWAQAHDKAVTDSLNDWMRSMGKGRMKRHSAGPDDPLCSKPRTLLPSPEFVTLEARKGWPKRSALFVLKHSALFVWGVLISIVAGLVLYYGLGIGNPSW